MSQEALLIYMDDHLAMMTGEIELAQRMASENDETELGRFLLSYGESVSEQQSQLRSIMYEGGKKPSPLKQTVTWLTEKIGRLKPNDSLCGYTDLARVLELEMLIAGAQLRIRLWETLSETLTEKSRNAEMIDRSKELSVRQVASLREFHRLAKRVAFCDQA